MHNPGASLYPGVAELPSHLEKQLEEYGEMDQPLQEQKDTSQAPMPRPQKQLDFRGRTRSTGTQSVFNLLRHLEKISNVYYSTSELSSRSISSEQCSEREHKQIPCESVIT